MMNVKLQYRNVRYRPQDAKQLRCLIKTRDIMERNIVTLEAERERLNVAINSMTLRLIEA